MTEEILVSLKHYNNKFNQMDDALHNLREQYDKTQFEIKCIKKILLEICSAVAPNKEVVVREMLEKHDKVYRTLHDYGNIPLAHIRFNHQLSPDLGSVYVWNVF
ncbi:hypothetical protein [Diatraea saccharalis granulovirus]|uniref:Uncharacterized protein n=1 Tax=Diatraea saccharalis granulovirus TaxID=1675862 RepID=A0A0R7EYQ9_9BBAC|nr:hypothetical protein [Diatraea saccharalis granulovirus]AKN80714.1 hypothetical protein [Diatraea saccharalis granulovirus]